MKKASLLKRIISILMVTVLILLPTLSTFASASENEEYPNIFIPGIMASDIYRNVNAPEEGLAWPPSTDSILSLVKNCIPALLEFSITRNWDKLGHAISPLAYNLFDKVVSDADGKITNGSGVIFEYPTQEKLQENPNSVFSYDWREDPIDTATKLNDYINYVLEVTGAEKVTIECHSLGGVVALSYCSLYGYEKIDCIVFNTAAIYGTSFAGDLLSGDMMISGDSLMTFMDFVADGTEQEDLLTKIFDILECSGLGDLVAELGNTILENLTHILLPEVVIPLFGKWLSIWALVPDEKIDAAMEYTFTHYIDTTDPKAQELKANIENYNNLVRKGKTEKLLEIDEYCKIGVISRYGYSSIPATSSWKTVSDGVLDSKSSSFGATFALYGAVLDDDIIANTAPEYISPDKTIDASTCIFPEKTWFIKGTKHSNGYSDLSALVKLILTADEEVTVDTFDNFPRFMKYDFDSNSIIADTGENEVKNDGIFGFFAKIKAFFADFMDKLRKFFGIIK